MILDKELSKLGFDDCDLEVLLERFDYKTIDDIYVGIGCGDLSLQRIINVLSELYKNDSDPLLKAMAPTEKKDDANAVSILGLKVF